MNHPDEPTQALPTPFADEPSDETTAVLTVEQPAPGPSPLVWIASAMLVLALMAGVAWFAVTTSRQNRENAMRGAAVGYLQAVADGDAAGALAQLAEQPASTTLLTDEVLAKAHEATPITDVQAGELGGTETTPTVGVSYLLGGEPVSTTITITEQGGSWKVADGTADLTVPERRALTVNGVELTEEVNPVFPGTYTAAPVSDMVALTGEPTVVVSTPDQLESVLDLTVGLSQLGTDTVFGAVKGRFDECLAATESRPANCPFGVDTTGVEVAEGSVKFAQVNDPWAGFAPTLDPETMLATGTFPFEVNATATVSRDGLTTEATAPMKGERTYTVDLTKQPATVTWS